MTRRIAAIALILTPLYARGQAGPPPPFAAYQTVSQAIPDQDAGLINARAHMVDDVSEQAMPNMLQAANHGDASAMRALGCVYWDGLLNHPADQQWGLQWFQRAAVAGDQEAVSMIGDHYLTGAGGPPNFDLAKLWYQKGYAAKDARSTIGLAEMSCHGNGSPQNIAECGSLLDEASSFMKQGDALDVKPMVAEAMFEVAGDYGTGLGIAHDAAQAASWYAKSAALGRPTAAAALSRLYIEPGGLPVDLPEATATLDSYMKQFGPNPTFSEPDEEDFANTYNEIGAAYEKMGAAQLPQAITVYRQAANLGYPDALMALALRYAQGDGLPQNLPIARSLLTDWNVCVRDDTKMWTEYYAVVGKFNDLVKSTGNSTPIEYMPCPLAAQATAAPEVAPPMPVQPRYPNMIAPVTVIPLQKFPVLVSLNTAKLDAGTTIVSAANQQNGELGITLPAGMTSILIAVNLVSPQMTMVDGVSTQNIELTINQDSTTAVFQLQAGSDPGVEPMFATLTYNGAFIAMIRRDVTVGAALASPQITLASAAPAMQAPAVNAAPPQQPPPAQPPAQLASTSAADAIAPPAAPASAAAAPSPALQTVGMSAPPAAQPAGVRLEPELRAPDITIQEIQSGTGILYTVTSPLLPGFEKSVEASAAARQAIVAKLYSDLESRGNAIDAIGTPAASQQARDFAEGQGAILYDNEAPQAFKTVYQKLKKLGAPPQTIEVLTDDPSLPWELMRPMTDDGKREGFLGLTLSVVHSTASSTPRVPPPSAEALNRIAVVMPTYSGDQALPGAQKELQAMKASFPGLDTVKGDVTDVSSLARDLPDGIIHYAGHGVRVTNKGLPPDVGILLNDGSLVPATWMNLAETTEQSHPFYFFNACDLGQSDSVLNYVDGWAPKLMASGASGYLGALWKVSDATATSFSSHFYADLKQKLSGTQAWSVADVVTQARQQTYAEAFDPTALAYVLYSAPYQTLQNGSASAGN